jgi:hypothetical protein
MIIGPSYALSELSHLNALTLESYRHTSPGSFTYTCRTLSFTFIQIWCMIKMVKVTCPAMSQQLVFLLTVDIIFYHLTNVTGEGVFK